MIADNWLEFYLWSNMRSLLLVIFLYSSIITSVFAITPLSINSDDWFSYSPKIITKGKTVIYGKKSKKYLQILATHDTTKLIFGNHKKDTLHKCHIYNRLNSSKAQKIVKWKSGDQIYCYVESKKMMLSVYKEKDGNHILSTFQVLNNSASLDDLKDLSKRLVLK